MGGASSKTQSNARVVSRYHEFVASIDAQDRAWLARVPIDENGVIRKPGFPTLDCILSLLGEEEHQDIDCERVIHATEIDLLKKYDEIYKTWRQDFRWYDGPTEQIDVSELSDWFPLFVGRLEIHSVHLMVTTELNTIKLTRALMLLFLLGHRDHLLKITISFRFSLFSFILRAVDHAREQATALTTKRNAYYSKYILWQFHILSQPIDKWIMMSMVQDDENGTAHLTYEFDTGVPRVKKLK
jgi:hypothetical protein